MEKKYEWKYCSLGGAVRVNIASGEDIAHLGELDQKLWTVLSCPVDSLEFDKRTLDYIDTDKDGKIKVAEVVAAAQWLTSVIKDKDLILKGESVLDIENIDTASETGRRLRDSAGRILTDLGREGNRITVEEASDSVAIFSGTRFNGDGLITEGSTDDASLKAVIKDCIAVSGAETDRSGALPRMVIDCAEERLGLLMLTPGSKDIASARELVCMWSIACLEILDAVLLPALLAVATATTLSSLNDVSLRASLRLTIWPAAARKVVSFCSMP